MLREKIYCDRKDLDDFLLLSPAAALNKSIYDVLLSLREPEPIAKRLHRINAPALQLFNEAYYQCTKLHSDKHPEEDLQTNYFADARETLGSTDAAEVVFSIVFVLLSSMTIKTVRTGYFAELIGQCILSESPYFSLFTPIVEQYQTIGITFPMVFFPMPADVSAPANLDWGRITRNFNPDLIAEAVLLASNEEGQHAILDAVEFQFKHCSPSEGNKSLDAVCASLRTAIVARFQKDFKGFKKEDCTAINHSLISQKKEVEEAYTNLVRQYRDLLNENQVLKKNQFNVPALLKIARDEGITDIYQVLRVFASGIDLPERIKVEQEIASNPNPDELFKSEIHLNPKRGMKINIERIIDCTWALGFYVDANGLQVTQQHIFDAFGRFLNIDLSNFAADLSQGRARANADCRSELEVFQNMLDRQKAINGLPI